MPSNNWIFQIDSRGKYWHYNREGVKQICWAWARAKNLRKHSAIATQQTSVGLAFSMTTGCVETDFKEIRFYTNSDACTKDQEVRQLFLRDGQAALAELQGLRQQARTYLRGYQDMLTQVNQMNQAAIANMGRNTALARGVAEVGASALVASAVVLTGGAAAGFGFLGAGLKGTFKYMDTGDIASAAVETVCEGALVVVGVGASAVKAVGAELSTASKVIVAVMFKAPMEMAKSVAGGDTMKQAAAAGAVEAGMDGVAPALGAIAKYLPKVPMIATIGSKLKETGKEFLSGTIEDQVSDKAKDKVKSMVGGSTTPPVASPGMRPWCDGFINHRAIDPQYINTYALSPYRN